MASPLFSNVQHTVVRHDLIRIGDRLLVACSGGPDSVALLHLLYAIKDKYKLQLWLAHINHNLRGQDSKLDEAFVRNLGRQLYIPVQVKKIDVRKLAQRKRLSIEETARQARYEFFEILADRLKIDKIATGHTQNDQAETVLMRFLRGSGPTGLSGIPIKRGKIIRPLLEIPRAEILSYLKKNKIEYRVDKTNLEPKYQRNRIRQKLLPQLTKQFNPNLSEVLSRTAMIFSQLENFIRQKAEVEAGRVLIKKDEHTVTLSLPRFRRLHPALQAGLARLAWEKLSGEIYPLAYQGLERLLDLAISGKTGQRVNLRENYWAEKSRGSLILVRLEAKADKLRIPPGKTVGVDKVHFIIKSEVLKRKELPVKISTRNQKEAYLDFEKFGLPPILRNWEKGERFRPLGMKGSKKLSDFFTDLKIPRHQRESIPVISSNGKIAWVVGYRISEDFKITTQTKKVLHLQAETMGVKN